MCVYFFYLYMCVCAGRKDRNSNLVLSSCSCTQRSASAPAMWRRCAAIRRANKLCSEAPMKTKGIETPPDRALSAAAGNLMSILSDSLA